ncbi:MAG: hypothetical protein WCP69_04860 [Bacteroidota bacterium]
MNAEIKYIDILDRKADYELIYKETFRTELGLRAISIMYDEHSNDKKSHDNILRFKDNIQYRLFSATHQYLVLLKELWGAESYLQNLYKKNPRYINSFPFENPFFDKVEQELSSVFDNVIFQVTSIFDYLSHIVCYITFTNKTNTLYWTKLARASRGQNNDFSNIELKNIIDIVDRRFVGKLYDYRSRLIHDKRDRHIFNAQAKLIDFQFNLQLLPSDVALKHFKLIKEEIPVGADVTLTYLASWLIKRAFFEIETILDVLSIELKKGSNFHSNLINPKRGDDALLFITMNPETRQVEPLSNGLWKEYKEKTKSVKQ